MESTPRFDRLETKIDKLAEAMVKLVEIDTKIDGLVGHNVTQDTRLNRHSETIDQHAILLATVTKVSDTNEWFVRILIASLVAAVAFMIRS